MLSSSHFQWSRGRILLLLTALCALLFFYRLNVRDFETTDEARRALVVRAMIESGDYVIPTLSGQVYLKKPPLYYWLAASVSRVADSTDEWVYRLPSALAALGSVLLLFLLAERLLDRRAALLSSVMLATCVLFIIRGSRAQIDMTLTFLVLVAMLCLERARAAGWTGWASWGFWGAIGFALLAKGPAGLLFPIGAALALAAGPGFLDEVRRMRPGRGLLIILAIVLPWGIVVLKSVGVDNALGILAEEAFGGFNETGVRHREPFLFYLYETPAQFLPWCLFLPAALLALREAKTAAELAALRFAGAWFLPALIVLSFSHQKRSFYMLPAFGALAIWHGWTVDRFVLSPAADTERPLTRKAARAGLTAICALAIMGALAGGAYLHANEPEIFAALSIPLAAIGLWALYALVSFRRGTCGLRVPRHVLIRNRPECVEAALVAFVDGQHDSKAAEHAVLSTVQCLADPRLLRPWGAAPSDAGHQVVLDAHGVHLRRLLRLLFPRFPPRLDKLAPRSPLGVGSGVEGVEIAQESRNPRDLKNAADDFRP